jgi:hypothetical protein
VLLDNLRAGRLAAEHLLSLGHRDIACIAGPPDVSTTEDRLTGFRETLARAGAATAELLALPEAELARFRNGLFRVTSFHVSQRQILDAVLRATGTTEADWAVTTPDSGEANKDFERRLADKPDGDMHVDYEAFTQRFMLTHFLPGSGGDFNDKAEDLSRFGLGPEDLDEATRKVVASLEKA